MSLPAEIPLAHKGFYLTQSLHRGQTSEHANKNKLRRETVFHRVLNTYDIFGKRPKNSKSTEC